MHEASEGSLLEILLVIRLCKTHQLATPAPPHHQASTCSTTGALHRHAYQSCNPQHVKLGADLNVRKVIIRDTVTMHVWRKYNKLE